MHLYISEEASWQAVAAAATPIWSTFEVPLAEQQEPRRLQYVYRPSPAVQANGSVYVHAVFVPTGASPNPKGRLTSPLGGREVGPLAHRDLLCRLARPYARARAPRPSPGGPQCRRFFRQHRHFCSHLPAQCVAQEAGRQGGRQPAVGQEQHG